MTPLYLSGEIYRLEQAATHSGVGGLMARAGLAAAEMARKLAGEGGRRILVVAGPGNNGGDALVAARHLKSWWFQVSVFLCGDHTSLPPDAADALAAWRQAGGTLLDALPADGRWDVVVDGLFGIGLTRALDARHMALVEQINRHITPILALDVPSGLNADTGQVLGAAVRASHTLTFIAMKPGLFTADGADYSGEVHLTTLGLEAPALLPQRGSLLERSIARVLPPRPRNSHKGLAGSAAILGGAQGMIGATLLSGRAALKLGAGRVYLGLLAETAPPVDLAQPELMLRPPETFPGTPGPDCLVVGPGLGQSPRAHALLERLLPATAPLLLDADALNLIAAAPTLQTLLKERPSPALLTPHPAEAARLLACDTREVQNDRIAAALALAEHFNSLVLIKGAGSLCATPDGRWFVNPTSNPGMSSAGMGDVLSGMIAALLAQRVAPLNAMLLAVYLHGAAADALVAQGSGPFGLTASETTDMARTLLNRWVSHNSDRHAASQ
jgi:hydroxyethylthiazole kinase-like uncharacterized protein yjeF